MLLNQLNIGAFSESLKLCCYMRLQMSSPDKYQTEALVDIARLFGWSKFVIIADNSDYGAPFLIEITYFTTK